MRIFNPQGKDAQLMNRSVLLATLVTHFIAIPSFAAKELTTGKGLVEEFKVEEGKQTVKTVVPKGWEPIVDYLNTPLVLVSKKGVQDLRTVIQVVPYGVKDPEDNLQKIKKDPDEFYSQKEEDLEASDGESISYEPFKEVVKDGMTICSIGIRYSDDHGEFLDRSYYISTKSKELFYVKALVPVDQEKEHIEEVDRTIASIAAQN
jgi:hypothetical protein